MSKRDEVLNLHNQGLSPEEIVEALSTPKSPLTKGEVLTKIAQCRREDPKAVRPDDVTPEKWAPRTPHAQSRTKKELNLVELVKAWNQQPDGRAIALRFGMQRGKLVQLIGRLRCKGVALLPALAPGRLRMQQIREAALSVLTEEQKAALAAPKKRGKVVPLQPEKALA